MSQNYVTRQEHEDLKALVRDNAIALAKLEDIVAKNAGTINRMLGQFDVVKYVIPTLTGIIGILVGLLLGHVAL